MRTASGFCENANVHSYSIKGGHFLEQLTDYQLLAMHADPTNSSWETDTTKSPISYFRSTRGPRQFVHVWWNSARSIIFCTDHPFNPAPRAMSEVSVVGQRTYCRQGQRFLSSPTGLNQRWCAIILLTQECCICRLAANNAFPPGQVLKVYCREEAMSVVTGMVSCTVVQKKQENLLCWLPRRTDRPSLLDFQFESAVSGLGNSN